MIRILFVCTNNICRSPMAAAIFSALVQETEWKDFAVDSAGTSSHYAGELPHAGTLEVLASHGIPCHHEARQLAKEDVSAFDYILAMDERNIKDIDFLFGSGRTKVVKLLEYAPHIPDANVPDPYFGGDFEGAYQIIREGVVGLLTHLQRELR